MKHPPSIISIDDSVLNGVGLYDAYVYSFTHYKTGEIYIGSKLGMFDGTYWHSSLNTKFCRLFSGSEPLFYYKIINYGLYIDMQNLESKLQSEVSAKSNPLYYNNAVAPTGNNELIDIEKCHKLVESVNNKIENGEIQEEEFDSIKDLESVQSRYAAEDLQHIGRIKDGLRETGLKYQKPVVIWEGMSTDDGDLVGDGNHTIKGIDGILNINTIKTVRIPEEIGKDFNMDEVRYCGNLFNPRQNIAKLENDEEDAIKTLIGLKEKGTTISGDQTTYGKDLVKGLGFKGRQPAAIVAKAEKRYKSKILAKSGQKIAKYDTAHPENLKELDRKADSLRNDHTIVVKAGTAIPSKMIRAIMEAVTDTKIYPNHYAIELVFFHNADSSKEKWDNGEHSNVKRLIRDTLKMFGPMKYKDENGHTIDVERTFNTHGMDHYQSDIS
tara:strand:+ start:416 stop:1732 length:1317 start_codon:yes stop_codon:yes gene_type:complete